MKDDLLINIPDLWNESTYDEFIKDLVSLKDEEYLSFSKKITFTDYEMIGIRVPIIREIAKKIKKTDYLVFLDLCKRNYFEEILLEGIVLGFIKEYNLFIEYFYKFLPFIDNWAICDMSVSSMKIIGKNKDEFWDEVLSLVKDEREYFVRVGIIVLMDYYILPDKINDIFKVIDSIKRNEYYIEMAIAWLISVCFVKYKEETIRYFDNNNLSSSVINKAIQKIRDSKRVSDDDKKELLKYKK